MSKSRVAGLILFVFILMGSCFVHGTLISRWADAEDMQAAGQKLGDLPHRLGTWQMVSEDTLDPSASEMLKCHYSLVRQYKNSVTGESIAMFVIYGPRGPIAVHVPEVCYSSLGTEPLGDRKVKRVDSKESTDEFWVTQFRKQNRKEAHLEVWYAWSNGGEWKAATRPRFWRASDLYKIQVAASLNASNEAPIQSFLESALPYLNGLIVEKS